MLKPIIFCAFFIISIICGTHVLLHYLQPVDVTDVRLDKVRDGVYTGLCEHGYYNYRVEVRVQSHVIEDVRIMKNKTNRYARKAEGVITRIISKQSPAVDAVSGATTASSVLKKAVQNALEKGLVI